MATPAQTIDYSSLFADTLENKEWELYIAMGLFNHMDIYLNPREGESYYAKTIQSLDELSVPHFLEKTIHLREFIPDGWGLKKTYIYLFKLLAQLDIEVDVVFEKEAYRLFLSHEKCEWLDEVAFAKFFIQDEWNLMFQDDTFWNLSESLLQLVHIRKSFSSSENLKKVENFLYDRIDEFVSGDISKRYNLLPYEKQRGLLMNKFADLYWNSGATFNIKFEQFTEYKNIAPVHTLVLLWKLGYIHIYHKTTDYLTWSITRDGTRLRDYTEDNVNSRLHIKITDKAITLLKEIFEVRDIIIDKMFNEDYTQLQIRRKDKKIHILEWRKELAGGSKRMTELMREYPNADITFKNYNGKTNKIIVLERTKMNTDSQSDMNELNVT